LCCAIRHRRRFVFSRREAESSRLSIIFDIIIIRLIDFYPPLPIHIYIMQQSSSSRARCETTHRPGASSCNNRYCILLLLLLLLLYGGGWWGTKIKIIIIIMSNHLRTVYIAADVTHYNIYYIYIYFYKCH